MKKEDDLSEYIAENEEMIDQEVTADDEIAKLIEENQKLKDEYLRALAESENVKKRCTVEIEKNNKYAIATFAKNMLSVADNLRRALNAVENAKSEDCEGLRKGVELTLNELNKIFEKFGVSEMNIMDTVFDPNFHQVVQEIEDKTKPNGTIIAELQKGYMINDRILREAMVVVTKGGN